MWLYLIGIVIAFNALKWLLGLPKVGKVHKKCVVITGCDSGFGKALARSLYDKGVYVFAGCFTQEGARKLAEETGERLRTFPLDVRDSQSIKDAAKFVKDSLPQGSVLWGLVNNAGIPGQAGPIEFIARRDMREVMETNCFGAMDMTQAFLPMVKKSRGRIVNVASVAGKIPITNLYPYIASKFALAAITEALRNEKSVWGIKVSTICPAFFQTNLLSEEMILKSVKDKQASLSPEVMEELGQEYIDHVGKSILNALKSSPTDLSPVIDDIEHALFARRPHAVYKPGIQGKILMALHDWCPLFVTDLITQFYTGAKPPKALS